MQKSMAMMAAVLAAAMFAASSVSAQGTISVGMNCVFNYTDSTGLQWNYDFSSLPLQHGQDAYYALGNQPQLLRYRLNVCASVFCNEANAAVCQLIYEQDSGTFKARADLGYYDGSTGAAWDIANPAYPMNGIKFSLTNGDSTCPGSNQPYSATVYFDCDPTATDPQATNITVNNRGCGYEFHMPTAVACGTNPPNPSPFGPSPGSGGGSLSGGSIFLIIFFVFGFVYVAGGCIFRRVSYGVSGMEACPNHEFWQQLPGLVTAGAAYFWNTLTCRAAGASSNMQYDNVK